MADGPYYAKGIYEGEVQGTGLVESKSKGTPGVEIQVKIVASVPQDGNPPMPEERQYVRSFNIWLPESEKAREISVKKLRAAGWEGNDFSDFLNGVLDGKTIRLECTWEQGTGDNANRLYDRFNIPLPEFELQPIESNPALARKLNALVGKTLKGSSPAAAPKAPAKPAPVASSNASDPPDDDIPF